MELELENILRQNVIELSVGKAQMQIVREALQNKDIWMAIDWAMCKRGAKVWLDGNHLRLSTMGYEPPVDRTVMKWKEIGGNKK